MTKRGSCGQEIGAETGGAKELVISRCKGQRPQKRRERVNEFTDARKRIFLDEFAATCNVTMAAEKVGLNLGTIYRHRRSDGGFRLAWAAAQEQGYAALEADLVLRARDLLGERELSEEAQARLSGMDAKLAFAVLQNFQKNRGREPGDIIPRKSDLGEATKRLEQVMSTMKLLPSPDIDADADGTHCG